MTLQDSYMQSRLLRKELADDSWHPKQSQAPSDDEELLAFFFFSFFSFFDFSFSFDRIQHAPELNPEESKGTKWTQEAEAF